LPRLAATGAQLFSLQRVLRDGDAELLRATPDVTHLADGFADFADTAAVVSRLDLVISVDTSVAHLAGAMGKPVWVLLPFAGDWHWIMHGRDDSPCYPTARLFRQPQPDDWDSVVARLCDELGRSLP
jgi:ADP-heptose:LPS heptosyltransferase